MKQKKIARKNVARTPECEKHAKGSRDYRLTLPKGQTIRKVTRGGAGENTKKGKCYEEIKESSCGVNSTVGFKKCAYLKDTEAASLSRSFLGLG